MTIKWTEEAKNDLKEIVEFFNERNASKTYSRRLVKEIKSTILRLKNNTFLGRQIENEENLRVIIWGDYKIFYKINQEEVEIRLIYDSRRKPIY